MATKAPATPDLPAVATKARPPVPVKAVKPAPVVTKAGLPITPLPADWMEQLAVKAQESAAKEVSQSPYISTRGGALSHQEKVFPDNRIDCVILEGGVFERSYYAEKYDPNEITPPVCFAIGRDESTLVPHDNSLEKQHRTCAGCPQAEFGSDPQGGRAPACKMRRRLALISADCLEQDIEAIIASPVIGLKVMPTSVKNWSQYVAQVANVVKRPPFAVVTRVQLRPHPKFLMELQFTFNGIIAEAHLPAVMARTEEVGGTFLAPWDRQDPEAAAAKAAQQEAERVARAKKGPRKYT